MGTQVQTTKNSLMTQGGVGEEEMKQHNDKRSSRMGETGFTCKLHQSLGQCKCPTQRPEASGCKNSSTSCSSKNKTNRESDGRCQGEAADDFEGVLPATAGAVAFALGALCCSVVGNGFGGLVFGGVIGILEASLRS